MQGFFSCGSHSHDVQLLKKRAIYNPVQGDNRAMSDPAQGDNG